MAINLKIGDRAGVLPVAKLRSMFEAAVRGTPRLAREVRLDPLYSADEFLGYVARDTDTMWFGFSLGLRCAERAIAAHAEMCDCVRPLSHDFTPQDAEDAEEQR